MPGSRRAADHRSGRGRRGRRSLRGSPVAPGWLPAALALSAVVAADPAQAFAQTGADGPSLTSEAGVYAEGYALWGRPDRRPDVTLRLFANPRFEWMGFRLGGNLLWSTEQRFVAQPMNRYYLNPGWSWGEVHLGDYVPRISRYSAWSMPIRGGGVELQPGPFDMAFAAGRAQEADARSPFDAAPRRMVYSGRLGVGDPDGTFFRVAALRAVDEKDGVDSLGVQPRENLVGEVAAGLRVGGLTLGARAAGSLFTRDTRASEITDLEVPEPLGSLFTPRAGSRADYAWSLDAGFTFGRTGSLGVETEYVGPGFTTLGDPYLVNDRLEVRGVGRLRVLSGRLNANASLGRRRDNLADDRRGTTFRTTGTLTVTALPTDSWTSTVSVVVNGLSREVDLEPRPGEPEGMLADSFRIANTTRAFNTVQQLRFEAGGLPQRLTFSYNEQRVDDSSPRFGTTLDATSRTLSLEYGLTLARAYRVSIRPGYRTFDSADQDQSFPSVTLSLARSGRSWLSGRASTSYTRVRGGRQFRQRVSATLRLSDVDRVTARVRQTSLRGVDDEFDELLATVRYVHVW